MTPASDTLPGAEEVRRLHDLAGRTALVTGGGSGLGRAMAWGLACFGADIAIVDRDGAAAQSCAREIAQGTGRRTAVAIADVSIEAEVDAAAAAILRAFGQVDILVNNAGHNVRKPLLEFSCAEFDAIFAVHVRGAFLFSRAIAGDMQVRRSGTIINIASMLGYVGAPHVVPYAAAKAALAQMTRAFALEMAPHGVRVNSIAPGYIDTALTRTHAPEVRKRITDVTPLARFGETRELIGPILFLASDASSFVTGSTLFVDGGWTAQ